MASINLNEWAGFLFIGVAVAISLYGLSCAQAIYYFRRYPNDSKLLKGFIALLWVLDTARAGTDAACIYFWMVTNHSQLEMLAFIPHAFAAEFGFSKFVIVGVQFFFITTIWKLLDKNPTRYPLTLLGLALTILAFGSGLKQTVDMASNSNGAQTIPENLVSGTLGLGAAFAADIYITVSLCLILHGHKTSIRQTQNMISALISFAATRGIFTAVFQIASCISYGLAVHAKSVPWALTIIPATSVYINSLLATLNIRDHFRNATFVDTQTGDMYPGSFRLNTAESSLPSPLSQTKDSSNE